MLDAINPNQSSKYDDQPKPPSAESKEPQDAAAQQFVVLPHHPLYGCLVTILKRRVATTYVDCTIEDPAVLQKIWRGGIGVKLSHCIV